MKRIIFISVFYLFAPGINAQAMKPGLWEMKSEMQNAEMDEAMASMQEQLANMPPDQRKQMESMMAKSGVGLGNKGGTVKVCIGKEQAANLKIPNQNQNCKQDIVEKKPGYVKLKFTCTNPASKGESEINFQSETSFKGKYSITRGTGEKMDMTQSGRWLGDSCGNLKPIP